MRKKTNKFSSLKPSPRQVGVFLVVCGLIVGSMVSAQQTPPGTDGLSSQQMLKQADKQMGEMKATLKMGFEQLAEARESQDIDKLNTVNEALSAIKGLLRLAEQNFVGLQEAVAKGDKKDAEHEFVKITIAYDKIMELGARIRAASGKMNTGAVPGQATVDTVKDDDLPTEDPLEAIDEVLPVDVDRPESSTPFFPSGS